MRQRARTTRRHRPGGTSNAAELTAMSDELAGIVSGFRF